MQLQLELIRKMGASLIAVAPETPDHTLSTQEKNGLTFEVLCDRGNEVARLFGIVFQLPVDLRKVYAGFGKDISKVNGDESFELPIPATYVIGTDRKIRKAFLDPNYTKRLDPLHIIEVLRKMAAEE